MVDYQKFAYGGTSYPLTASTTNTLLRDADPALYYAIDYFQSVLTTHLNARVVAEVARSPAITTITAAVSEWTPMDPGPYLNEQQFRFPLLAVYRMRDDYQERTATWVDRKSEWGLQYILPPVAASQYERMFPLLKAVSDVLHNRIESMMDPSYSSGLAVWAAAGIGKIELIRAIYGRYEAGGNMYFPALNASLAVTERVVPATADLETLAGIDADIDQTGPEQAFVADVADIQANYPAASNLPGIVTILTADSGITLASDNFRVASWASQVGSITFAPDAPANRPSIIQLALPNQGTYKPILRFDGSASFLRATITSLANDSGKTFVVLFRLFRTEPRASILLHTAAGDLGTKTSGLEANTVSSVGNRFGFYSTGSSFDSSAATDLSWHVAVIRESSTAAGSSIVSTTTYDIDGYKLALTSRSGSGNWQTMATSDQVVLGALPALLSSTAAGVDIGAVLICTQSLSDADAATAALFCRQWAGI